MASLGLVCIIIVRNRHIESMVPEYIQFGPVIAYVSAFGEVMYDIAPLL